MATALPLSFLMSNEQLLKSCSPQLHHFTFHYPTLFLFDVFIFLFVTQLPRQLFQFGIPWYVHLYLPMCIRLFLPHLRCRYDRCSIGTFINRQLVTFVKVRNIWQRKLKFSFSKKNRFGTLAQTFLIKNQNKFQKYLLRFRPSSQDRIFNAKNQC